MAAFEGSGCQCTDQKQRVSSRVDPLPCEFELPTAGDRCCRGCFLHTLDRSRSRVKVNGPNYLGHTLIWDALNKMVNHWAQKERVVSLRMSNCPLVHALYADVIG